MDIRSQMSHTSFTIPEQDTELQDWWMLARRRSHRQERRAFHTMMSMLCWELYINKDT
jgi:hypothetical protein